MLNEKISILNLQIYRIKQLKSNCLGATSISVVLLVAASLLLVCSAIFVFLVSDAPSKKITNSRIIEEVYAKEEQMRFFIEQIGLEVLEEEIKDERDYKNKFKEKLRSYRTKNQLINWLVAWLEYHELIVELKPEEVILKIPKFPIRLAVIDQEKVWNSISNKASILIGDYVNLEIHIKKEIDKGVV